MSILIKGIEIPKDKEIILRIDEEGQVYNIYGEYPTKTYEAIEIPPHGRLIDADALLSRIKESRNWIETNLGEAEKPLRIGYLAAYGETLAYIVNTPTIIESEGDE